MIKWTKLILIVSVLMGTALSAWADRGIGRKSKNKVSLNINTPSTLRKSISFNLTSGLTYTGSLLAKKPVTGVSANTMLLTYQKGNTVYIVPYKQKILVTDMGQGYTSGTKLIIRPH